MGEVTSTATTRGDLLREADAAITATERRLMSARRALPVLGWSIGLMIILFIPLDDDLEPDVAAIPFLLSLGVFWRLLVRGVPGHRFVRHLVAGLVAFVAGVVLLPFVEDLGDDGARAVVLVVWSVVALGVIRSSWVYARESSRLLRAVDAWRSARRDPEGRGLTDGDLPLELATVHDLRDRTDADDAVDGLLGTSQARLFDLRAIVPTFVLMITGIMGLAFLLAPVVGLDDGPYAPATAVSGALLLAPWAWAFGVDMMRLIVGRQTEANQVKAEVLLYEVRRRHAGREPLDTPTRFNLLATPAGRLLLAAWLALVVLRLRTSSALTIGISVAIVLVATAMFTARCLRRWHQIRVYPLAGRGPSVVQAPGREVVLHLDDDALHVADAAGRAEPVMIPIGDIIALEPVEDLSAMARSGLGIVTTDAPIILTGRDVADDPAIVQLRRRLAR